MATTTSSSGSKGTTKGPARKRATSGRTTRARSTGTRTQALTDEAKAAVRSVRTRATRAAKKVPTDTTSLSIAAGVIAGLVAAGVAMFMNRDRLREVATSGGERLRRAADDLSTMAHDRIDQARDNITRFRGRDTAATPQVSSTDNISAAG